MTIRKWIICCLFIVMFSANSALALQLGDPAPELKIAEWIKGSAVDLKAGKGKNVYVLDFWATWCGPCRMSMPHLTELQKKYKDKGLVVVGISDENPNLLKSFVEKNGSKMEFTVAADHRMATTRAYMIGVGVNSIPYAFVIDKSGRVAWHGSPHQALDQVVELVINDKYDIEAAIQGEKAKKVLMEYFQTAVEADLAQKPDKKEHLSKKAKKIGQEILKLAAGNADVLDLFAWNILVLPQLKTRDIELASLAAKAANDLAKGTNASILDTYARTLWLRGKKAEAIKHQTQAVEVVKDPRLRKQFQDNLEQYKKEAPTPTSQAADG